MVFFDLLDAVGWTPHARAMNRLFLLDGMALIYRAHFALIQNPIRNSKGVNTSALYGFINTLLAIIEKERPTHLGVAFDTSAPTPRHQKFPAYKAQRDEMPEELAAAIPHVKSLCRAFRIPVLELDGYEADDIIGTLVTRAEARGDFESFMVTPDKDFAQLLAPNTRMWRPGRKGGEHEIISLIELPGVWGVEKPSQIIDLLGLMGDSADNIPGIPGIGPKTAQKLIAEFGNIENLLANTSHLKGKQKENIESHAENARLSKELATIIINVPIDVAWEDLMLSRRDDDTLKRLFHEFEFRTLAKRLFPDHDREVLMPSSGDRAMPATFKKIKDIEHTYQIANTPELQKQLFEGLRKQSAFCFDIETTSLDRFSAELLGIAFSWKAHEAWFLPIADLESQIEDLIDLFSSSTEKVGHNLKYDLCVLRRHGIHVSGPFFDTMLVDALVHPERRHGMDYLAEVVLGYSPIKLSDLASIDRTTECGAPDDLFSFANAKAGGKQIDMRSIPIGSLAEYAAEDADVTWQLAEKLRPLLDESGQSRVYHLIEGPLLPVLVAMEMEGIRVDPASLEIIGNELQKQIDSLAASIHAHAGKAFNLASPKQLGEVLFDRLKLADRPKKTKTGQYKTDEQTLAAMEGAHPMIAEILLWREATKLKSTYLDALPNHLVPSTGRIHTHFHQLVAATGRLASAEPNLQNIPIRSQAGRNIRKAFVAKNSPASESKFVILACDYSQIELRVMAAIANDPTMIAAFKHGTDIHTTTASKVFSVAEEAVTSEMRRTAKMVNFGIIYGISAFGLSQRLGIPRADAGDIIDAYFREYPAIRAFMEDTVAQARETGYAETLTGRRRMFPDLLSANQNLKSNAERAAINMPIQGSAADMIKLAMIRIDAHLRARSARSRLILQVHDELVFELCENEKEDLIPEILEIMRNALPLPNEVPVEVEFGMGMNWLEAH